MRQLLIWMLLIASAASTAARAEVIKLATIAPQDSPYYDILKDMGRKWEEISGGRIKLRIYASGVAGDENDVVRKMRIGQLHAAAISGGGLNDITPEMRPVQMPMFYRSDEERDFVVDRIHPEIETIMEQNGFKVLGWGSTGWLYFFTKEPVTTPDDLKRLTIHAWAGNSSYVEAWKRFGFRALPLPSTEIMTGLQSGLISAVTAPPIAALAFQWFGLAPHMTDLRWAPLEGAIVMSNESWQRIPDDLRPKIEQVAREACAQLESNLQGLSEQAIEVMKTHGLAVHPVSPEQKRAWEVAVEEGYKLIATSPSQIAIVKRMQELRDEYRATHAVQ